MSTPSHFRPTLRLVMAGWLAALGVLGLAGADDRGEAAKGPAKVPFEMLASNHMVVRARINGKGPYRLLFDVGSPVTLIGKAAAEATGLIKPGEARGFLFPVPVEAKVGALEIGGLTAKDVPVIVMDHPVLKALGGFFSRPLDGILGFTFFARYRLTLDYQAKEMTFEPVDYEVRDLMKTLPERLAGPKIAREIILTPTGLWGLTLAKPDTKTDSKPGPGVAVAAVAPDSPAASAGFKPGDVITTLDGRWTANVPDVYAAAAGVAPGTPVEVVVLRDGQEQKLTVAPRPGF